MGKYILGCLGLLVVGVIIIAIVAFTTGTATYNNLVSLKQDVDAKWSDVQTQYQRRGDLIQNLVNTVSGAANFEKSTLIAVTQARASVGQVKIDPSHAPTDQAQLDQYAQAQNSLGGALSHLLAVSERYPDLKSSQNFLDLQAQLEGTENRIAVSRHDFIVSTQAYDTAVQRFPTVLYARLLGFSTLPYFQAAAGDEKAPEVKFDFNTPATNAPAH